MNQTFGQYFRELRYSRGISLSQYAEALGIYRENLSKLENGKTSPPNTIAKVKQFILPLNPTQIEKTLLIQKAYEFHVERVMAKIRKDFAP